MNNDFELAQELNNHNIEVGSLYAIQTIIREEYKVNIEILGFVDSYEENICYFYHLRDTTKYSTYLILPNSDDNTYDTYEECLEAAIIRTLILLKNDESRGLGI